MPFKTYAYAYYDGDKPIEADVHYEQSSSIQSIALAIHGGGFSIGSKEFIPQAQIDYLVKHNFIVVSINYRLCPNISFYDGPITDTKAAYHWIMNQLPALAKRDLSLDVDASKTVVLGHSAGGHLTMTVGHEVPRPKALLNFYGPLNFRDSCWCTGIEGFAGNADISDDYKNKVYSEPVTTASGRDGPRGAWLIDRIKYGKLMPELVAGDPDKHDPVLGLTKDFPPTFFAHGDSDLLVPVDVTARYTKRLLEELQVETGLVVVKGGGHGYDVALKEGDEGWQEGVQDGLDFLIKHVK